MSNIDNSSCSSTSELSPVRGVLQIWHHPKRVRHGDYTSNEREVLARVSFNQHTNARYLAGKKACLPRRIVGYTVRRVLRCLLQAREKKYPATACGGVWHSFYQRETQEAGAWSQEPLVEDIWWTHLDMIRTLQGCLDRDTVELSTLPGAKRFGTGLTRRAFFLSFVVLSKIILIIDGDAVHLQLPTQKFRSVVQTISDQPRQVQARFLDLVGYIGNSRQQIRATSLGRAFRHEAKIPRAWRCGLKKSAAMAQPENLGARHRRHSWPTLAIRLDDPNWSRRGRNSPSFGRLPFFLWTNAARFIFTYI